MIVVSAPLRHWEQVVSKGYIYIYVLWATKLLQRINCLQRSYIIYGIQNDFKRLIFKTSLLLILEVLRSQPHQHKHKSQFCVIHMSYSFRQHGQSVCWERDFLKIRILVWTIWHQWTLYWCKSVQYTKARQICILCIYMYLCGVTHRLVPQWH